MKIFYITLILLSVNIIAGCSTYGKGNWTEADKEKAKAAVNSEMGAIIEAFGKEKAIEFADCYLESVEKHYKNFETADKDLEGCTKLAEKCAGKTLN